MSEASSTGGVRWLRNPGGRGYPRRLLEEGSHLEDMKVSHGRRAWVAPKVKRPTLAQVMISWFVSSLVVHGFEPRLRLCVDSSEPGACFGFFVSQCLCPSPARSLSLSRINTKKKCLKIKKEIKKPWRSLKEGVALLLATPNPSKSLYWVFFCYNTSPYLILKTARLAIIDAR